MTTTKYWLSRTGVVSPLTPAADSFWTESTDSGVVRELSTTRDFADSLAVLSVQGSGSPAPSNIRGRIYVLPLSPGVFEGSFRYVGLYTGTTSGGVMAQLRIRIVGSDGVTKVVLYAGQTATVGSTDPTASNYIVNTTTSGAAAVSRILSGPLAAYTVVAGDYLVASMGCRQLTPNGGSRYAGIYLGNDSDDTPADFVVNQTGKVGWLEITRVDAVPPNPPTDVSQSAATPTSATTSWTAPATGPTPTSYEARVDGGTAFDIGLVTSKTYTGWTPSTTKTFEVRSKNADGVSSWVSTTLTTLSGIPNPPTAVTQSLATYNSTRVEWTAPAAGEAPTSYEYQVNGAGLTDAGLVLLKDLTGLTPGSTPYFEVRSKTAYGVSTWASLSLTIPFGIPDPPEDLTPVEITHESVEFTWSPAPTGPPPTSFNYRLNGGSDVGVPVGTSAFVEDLSADTEYLVEVEAVTPDGSSSWSSMTIMTEEAPVYIWPIADDFESHSAGDEVGTHNTAFTGINWDSGPITTSDAAFTDEISHSGDFSITGKADGFYEELQLRYTDDSIEAEGDSLFWWARAELADGQTVYRMFSGPVGAQRNYDWEEDLVAIFCGGFVGFTSETHDMWWVLVEDGEFTEDLERTKVGVQIPKAAWVKIAVDITVSGTITVVFSGDNGVVYGEVVSAEDFATMMTTPQYLAFHNLYVSQDDYAGFLWIDDINVFTPVIPDPEPVPDVPAIGWDEDHDRYFHQGVDRGVLYPRDKNPVPWLGITGVDEASDSSTSVLYRDGVIYYSSVDPGDYSGKLTTFWYPDEFAECAGIPEVATGFHVDNQRPKPFNLCYRSLIGSGVTGDMFGYQIHLIYNATAQIGTRTRTTITAEGTDIDELSFDLVCTPIQLPGFRPSAHYIIDTRNLSAERVSELETILYGDGITPGTLPAPGVLYDIMKYGDEIIITQIGENKYKIEGSAANVESLGSGKWRINNVNSVDHGDGTHTLSNTP